VEKPPIVNGAELINHNIRSLFQSGLAGSKVNPEETGLGLENRGERANYS
jgi:hypothetical protein